jgi:histidinol-phosphatase (PHP family)
VVSAALNAGISYLAITEHFPLSHEIDPTNFVSMPWEKLDTYCKDILEQRAAHPEITVLLGCELDWLGAFEDRDMQSIDWSRFDYILGSVHFLDLWPFDDPEQVGHWDEVGHDAVWDRYFDQFCEACVSNMPYTTMSHPDLVKKFNKYPSQSFNYKRAYKMAAEAAQAGQRMVEVNTSGATYACKEMYPNIDLLKEFRKAGVAVTLGTDAHEPRFVNRGFQEGLKLIYEAGYREITAVLPGGDRKTIPLE